MGHTVLSQRIVIDTIHDELIRYGKSLYTQDQIIYNSMLNLPLKRISNISYTSSFHVWAFFLLSIILEQEKKIRQLEQKNELLFNGCIQEQEQDNTLAEIKQ